MNDQYDESQGDFPAHEEDLPSVEAMYGDLPAVALVQESEYAKAQEASPVMLGHDEGVGDVDVAPFDVVPAAPILLGPPAAPTSVEPMAPFEAPVLEQDTVTLPSYDALFGDIELDLDPVAQSDAWPPSLDHQQAWLDENFSTLPSMTNEPVWATVGREMNINVEDLLAIRSYGW